VRFQNKVNDTVEIDQILDLQVGSSESSHLWCHVDGRLIIYDALLVGWNKEKRTLRFQLAKNVNKLTLGSITDLNIFHEDLLLIYKSPVESLSDDFLTLKAPESILKLAEAEGFLPELMAAPSDGPMDKGDMELISQVLEVLGDTIKPKQTEPAKDSPKGPAYVFAKKPEIKETAQSLGFSNRGVVEEPLSETIDPTKKKRVSISKSGSEPSTYLLIEVETHGLSFHSTVRGEYKVGDAIVVHSILDNKLTAPLTAKITAFNKPSEYAKHFHVEAKFDLSYTKPPVKKVPTEKVGLKRELAKEKYSHETIYLLVEADTQKLQFIEKRKGEYNIGDRVIISTLYSNPLKKPINAQVQKIDDSSDARICFLEFLKDNQ
tara:strand:+ start:2899 stop:4026 length:1128 start_codon:yes stop_codon:yes gene_type:complete